ncbi:TATA box-binding protein-associated factor RNA polymerase I subunit B-like [Zingiber officinale]|uniref:TATA box-binding protein-associated factor RNA polymerase I subunit B n=1 Tax=Zingiber officinale TaxID=94328 RepID=A0A8J5C3Y7_ZINOF|nr:TATA box-binding protein-associated factor RNA polymerase I subunit B-like [Zingiber officinale]KAG6466008.1 hypothetical protein ZIOFF_076233 [Zingiber officinale]
MEDMDWDVSAFSGVKAEEDGPRLYCDSCGSTDFASGDDGFYYCQMCGYQSKDVVDTGFAMEDILGDNHGSGALYNLCRSRARTQSQTPTPAVRKDDILRSLANSHASGRNPKEEQKGTPYGFEEETSALRDFPTGPCSNADALASGIRMRYIQGLQVILQLQCEALVEKFGVSPIICGLAGTIWLRYVASSAVFDEGWARKTIEVSEAAFAQAHPGRPEEKKTVKRDRTKCIDPRNAYGQKAVYIWLRALRKTVPVYSSLSISFLVCHIAREAILPTDIHRWAAEAKLPYLAAHMLLDKYLGNPQSSCPLSSRLMFRPVRLLGAWQMESIAGSIAQTIGLHLPSVNFYALASRYLKDLSLPIESILPHACRLYEWSISPDLWLSSNVSKLPTRVCVMAILIVTIRMLYNIHGQGFWEKTLSDVRDAPSNQTPIHDCFSQSSDAKECGSTEVSSEVNHLPYIKNSYFNVNELLDVLQATYDRVRNVHDYSKDFKSFLKYSGNVILAGMTNSYDEETLIERLWEIYEKEEDDTHKDEKVDFLASNGKRQRDEVPATSFFDLKKPKEQNNSIQHASREGVHEDYVGTADQNGIPCNSAAPIQKPEVSNSSLKPLRNVAVERMKIIMEEHGFHYLPPRVRLRADGYLSYRRKKIDSKLTFAAHADYYILLRACAKIAEADIKLMHLGVQKFERRLAWLEQRIDMSLNGLADLLHKMHDE